MTASPHAAMAMPGKWGQANNMPTGATAILSHMFSGLRA